MGFLILEGADGAGKTTLAGHLERRYHVRVKHLGPPQRGTERLAEIINHTFGPDFGGRREPTVVFDRLHFGAMTYGPVFRGGPDLTEFEWTAFEHVLAMHGAAVVLCDPGIDEIIENVANKQDPNDPNVRFHQTGLQPRVWNLMEDAYVRSSLPKMVYDYRGDEALEIVEKFVEFQLGWAPAETGAAA